MSGLKVSQDLANLAEYLADDIKITRGITHRYFDTLWQSGVMTRTQAYTWLSETMQLPKKECHIALFNKHQCAKVQEAVNSFVMDKL